MKIKVTNAQKPIAAVNRLERSPRIAVEVCGVQVGRKEVLGIRESGTLPLVLFSL